MTLDPATTGEEYQGETLDIVVSAEAVQASHNAYQTVWGDLLLCRLACSRGRLKLSIPSYLSLRTHFYVTPNLTFMSPPRTQLNCHSERSEESFLR